MRLIVEFICYLVLAQMWNLLAGYGGLISIGQQAFFGLGGYALFLFANKAGVNPFVSILLAGGVAALLAIPTSQIVFRLQGGYFAVGTWVVAEVYRLLVAQHAAGGRRLGPEPDCHAAVLEDHARAADLLDRARDRRRGGRAGLLAAALALRAGADRDPRQRGGLRKPGHQRQAGQVPGLRPRRVRLRPGRRVVLCERAAHPARCRLQHRLDRDRSSSSS